MMKSMDMNMSKLWEISEDREALFMQLQRVGHDLATEKQQ